MTDLLADILNSPLFPNLPQLGQWTLQFERAATALLAVLALFRMIEAVHSLGKRQGLSTSKIQGWGSLFVKFWRNQPQVKIGLVLISSIMVLQILSSGLVVGVGSNYPQNCEVGFATVPEVLSIYMAIFHTSIQLIFYGISKSALKIESELLFRPNPDGTRTIQL